MKVPENEACPTLQSHQCLPQWCCSHSRAHLQLPTPLPGLSPTACPNVSQPQPLAPGWGGGTGPGGQTLPWQTPWAAPASWGPGNCSTTFLEMFWGCWLLLCSFKVNASLGFLQDPGPGQSSGRQGNTSTLCHSRVLGWNLLNFTCRYWLWKTLCWNQISKCNVGTWRTLVPFISVTGPCY